jgi:hypothetical protein
MGSLNSKLENEEPSNTAVVAEHSVFIATCCYAKINASEYFGGYEIWVMGFGGGLISELS